MSKLVCKWSLTPREILKFLADPTETMMGKRSCSSRLEFAFAIDHEFCGENFFGRFGFVFFLYSLRCRRRRDEQTANIEPQDFRYFIIQSPSRTFAFAKNLFAYPNTTTPWNVKCVRLDDTSNELWLICHQIPHIFWFIIRTKTPHRKIPFDTEIFCAKARRSAVFCLENDLCVDVILISIKAHSTICEKDT